MAVGSGHHRRTAAERIGECAGGDLVLAEIGRDVDIGRADVCDKLIQFEIAVAKHHAVGDAECRRERDERLAIPLALVAEEPRMGGAGDHVDRRRMPGDDPRHRVDHVLDPLAG